MKVAIGFSRTNSLSSRIIRWFTKSHVSHVYIRIYDKFFKVPFILHSDWGGVQFELAEKFDIANIPTEEYVLDDPRLDASIRENLWHLGKGYSYIKLINWAWVIIFKRWVVRKVKYPSTNPKKILCTDFILYIFNAAGVTNILIGSMTPADLRLWCEQNYEKLGWKRVMREKDSKTFLDYVKNFLMGDSGDQS